MPCSFAPVLDMSIKVTSTDAVGVINWARNAIGALTARLRPPGPSTRLPNGMYHPVPQESPACDVKGPEFANSSICDSKFAVGDSLTYDNEYPAVLHAAAFAGLRAIPRSRGRCGNGLIGSVGEVIWRLAGRNRTPYFAAAMQAS